jgi:hypothetical protein
VVALAEHLEQRNLAQRGGRHALLLHLHNRCREPPPNTITMTLSPLCNYCAELLGCGTPYKSPGAPPSVSSSAPQCAPLSDILPYTPCHTCLRQFSPAPRQHSARHGARCAARPSDRRSHRTATAAARPVPHASHHLLVAVHGVDWPAGKVQCGGGAV